MKGDDRKAAIEAYKERKKVAGIYAVRCAVSGEIWVGQSPNLDTIQSRIWFTLRLGNDPHQSLQKAWRDTGLRALRSKSSNDWLTKSPPTSEMLF